MSNMSKLRLTIPGELIEQAAWKQIYAALELPCLLALAIMPDVHAGYDLPVGGVALLDGHVWPGAVGFDGGCGMCHVPTGQTLDELPPFEDVWDTLKKKVPVGFASHSGGAAQVRPFPNAVGDKALAQAVDAKAAAQLGTLGGGNHFIEFGVNSKGIVGVTIHSGSRRPGWEIGNYYMRKTKGPVPVDSPLGAAYLEDMAWALQFALENRRVMMACCLQALGLPLALMATAMVNENHNHAEITPAGILHRKGATPALEGQLGIIPANMRDGVWITRGLGNEQFLNSASHGAGRAMSRGAAKSTLDHAEFEDQMAGILADTGPNLLDEAPGAYKPIADVLAAQDGILVDVLDHFRPLLVIKG